MESFLHQSHGWTYLADFLLILALSGMIVPVLQRLKISPILGYLLCGLIIGPYGLGQLSQEGHLLSVFVITDTDLIKVLAELGVIFLLFMIGLELTVSRLWELRKLVLGLGSLQILITTLVVFMIALQFDNSLPASVLIGTAFALSSTAIVMQILTEWHMISRPIGRICFSVLLMQDLAVVPILVLVSVLSGETESSIPFALLEALISAFVVILCIFAAGKLLLRPMLRILSPSQNAEWLLAISLFLVIGSSSLTAAVGLSAALGAFLAGLLIAETEYRHEIEGMIEPVKGILMGIFFLSVGMATNFTAVLDNPVWLGLSVIGIFLIKAALFFPLALLFSIPKPQAIQASIMLAQCGEFAFLIIGLTLAGGLLPQDDAQFFLMVATLSLLFTPFTTKLAPLAHKLIRGKPDSESLRVPAPAISGNHVIIAGFGRVGQTLAGILEKQMIPYIGIDVNGPHVAHLRAEGYPVIYGNARHLHLWQRLNVDRASAAILTVDEHGATDDILRLLQHNWPLLPVIMRTRDTSRIEFYFERGAAAVVPETLESTLQLAHTLLEKLGTDKKEIQEILNEYRKTVLDGEAKIIDSLDPGVKSA